MLLGMVACGGAQTPATEIESVRDMVQLEVDILATGIEREDSSLASQPVSAEFVMGNNVAIRYHSDGWNGSGIGKFRDFMEKVFDRHANIQQILNVREVFLSGDVAYARVYNEFSSVRTDRVPPEFYITDGWDLLIFERVDGGWQLRRWDEGEEPEAD
jgi:hypothetical protein